MPTYLKPFTGPFRQIVEVWYIDEDDGYEIVGVTRDGRVVVPDDPGCFVGVAVSCVMIDNRQQTTVVVSDGELWGIREEVNSPSLLDLDSKEAITIFTGGEDRWKIGIYKIWQRNWSACWNLSRIDQFVVRKAIEEVFEREGF